MNVADLVDDQVFALITDEKLFDESECEDQDVVLFKNVSTKYFSYKVFITE